MRRIRVALVTATLALAGVAAVPAQAAAGQPAGLTFRYLPLWSAVAGEPFEATVIVVDALGGPVRWDSSTLVTLALAPGSGHPGAVLGCVDGATHRVWDGETVFRCTIDLPGRDYRLVASAPGLPSTTSGPLAFAPAGSVNGNVTTSNAVQATVMWTDTAVPEPNRPLYLFSAWATSGSSTGWGHGGTSVAYYRDYRSWCDATTGELVMVDTEGLEILPRSAFTAGGSGAFFEGDLTLTRTEHRTPDCGRGDWRAIETRATTLRVHVTARWEATGKWIPSRSCIENYDPMAERGTIFVDRSRRISDVQAWLTITGGLSTVRSPADLEWAGIVRSRDVDGLPETNQPWDCFPIR